MSPQAIPLVAAIALQAVAASSLAIALQIALTVAITVGASFLQKALSSKSRPGRPTPEDVQTSFRQDVPPRTRHYGRVKMSGPWFFGGTNEGDFHKVIALGHGELDGIEEYWIDDKQVTLDGSNLVQTSPYDGDVQILTKLGADDETAYSELVSTFTNFTSAHRGRGIATLYAKQSKVDQDRFNDLFPNGKDTLYRVVARTSKVFNPVSGATAYDDNAALIVRDFMTSADGMRLPSSIFETPEAETAWAMAITRADEPIDLAAGGTIPRYRLWGSYKLTERPGDVVESMLANCDGRLLPTGGGGAALHVGAWAEPAITLTQDNIRSVTDLVRGLDQEQRPNTIRAKYLEPNADYSQEDAEPWDDPADVTERGVEPRDIDLIWSPHHSQARRLMKLEFYRDNPEWSMRLEVDLLGLALIGEPLVRVQLPVFGIDAVFEIQSLEIDVEDGIARGVMLDLIALPEAAFAWDAATEEGAAPVAGSIDPGGTSDVKADVPLMTGLNVTQVELESEDSVFPSAFVDWDQQAAGLTPEIRFKKTAQPAEFWQDLFIRQGANSGQTGVLSNAEEYEFQGRLTTATGRRGAFTSSVTLTPSVSVGAPDPVTSASGVAGSESPPTSIDLSWMTANDPIHHRTVIKRNTSNDEGSATEITGSPVFGAPNSSQSLNDSGLASGTYYYWLYAASQFDDRATGVATGAVTI